MNINFADIRNEDFDAQLYVKILVAITKADRNNGTPEINYVRNQANSLGLDFDELWQTTDKQFDINRLKVSRLTACAVLKACITLASLDRSYSLAEKEKVYTYAEKLDVPRSDVRRIERWLQSFHALMAEWDSLVSPDAY